LADIKTARLNLALDRFDVQQDSLDMEKRTMINVSREVDRAGEREFSRSPGLVIPVTDFSREPRI